jgi:hypothetical protein
VQEIVVNSYVFQKDGLVVVDSAPGLGMVPARFASARFGGLLCKQRLPTGINGMLG